MSARSSTALTIAGVGLIGGSLALAARAARAGRRGASGFGRSEANLRVARERGIVDRVATRSPRRAARRRPRRARGAGRRVRRAGRRASAPHAARRARSLTDVGSVKAALVAALEARWRDPRPRGRRASDRGQRGSRAPARRGADLFRGRLCILTPTRAHRPATRSRACARSGRASGARVEEMTPAAHDEHPRARLAPAAPASPTRWCARVAAARADGRRRARLRRAAGLRDTTRIAGEPAGAVARHRARERARRCARALAELRAALDRARARSIAAGDARRARARRSTPRARARRAARGASAMSAGARRRRRRAAARAATSRVPGDKSIAHRALLLGALADGTTTVRGFPGGADVRATLDAVPRARRDGRRATATTVRIDGRGLELGTAARRRARLRQLRHDDAARARGSSPASRAARRSTATRSLRRRPMERVAEPLRAMGARDRDDRTGTPPVARRRRRGSRPSTWTLPVASAQVKSAILLAGLRARGHDARARAAARRRDHTERLLRAHGRRRSTRRRTRVARRAAGSGCAAPTSPLPGRSVVGGVPRRRGAARPGLGAARARRRPEPDPHRRRSTILAAHGRRRSRSSASATRRASRAATLRRARGAAARRRRSRPTRCRRAIDELPVLAVAAALRRGRDAHHAARRELRVKESDRLAALRAARARSASRCEEPPTGSSSAAPAGGRSRGARIDAARRSPHRDGVRGRRARARPAASRSPTRSASRCRSRASSTLLARARRGGGGARDAALVVAIDGPAGAGKSTASRALARAARLRLRRHRRDVPRRRRAGARARRRARRRRGARGAASTASRFELRRRRARRSSVDGRDVTQAIRAAGRGRAGVAGVDAPGGARAAGGAASARSARPAAW